MAYETSSGEIAAYASKVKRNGILIIILGVIWTIFSFIGIAGAKATGDMIANILYLLGGIGYIVVGAFGVMAGSKVNLESAKRFHLGLIIIFIVECVICLAYMLLMILLWLQLKKEATEEAGEAGAAVATGLGLLLILVFGIAIGLAMLITCCCCYCCINTAKAFRVLLQDQSVWAQSTPAQTA